MNKLTIYFLLISHSIFSQTITLERDSILIGEQVKLKIISPTNKTDIWPNAQEIQTKDIEIIRESNIDTTNNTIYQEFIITVWDSGSYYIPSIKFSANNITPKILLNVYNINIPKNAELKDIKSPIQVPIGWSDICPYIIIIIIICLIIFLLRKYFFRKNKKVTEILPKEKIPEDIQALNELQKLESSAILQAGKIKEYHTRISEILRKYLELRFKFIALELTTYEIIQKLETEIDKENIKNIKTVLERSDLAKFAKGKPSESENNESMSLSRNIIISTKNNTNNE